MEIETKETLVSQHFWYVVFTIAFVTLLSLFVTSYGVATMNSLLHISVFHFVVLSLATFRITRLIVSDRITQWLRDTCLLISISTDEATGLPCIVRTKRIKGFRRAFGDIIGCQWCTGMWTAFLVLFLYIMAMAQVFQAGWIILFVFAIAGVASIIQAFIPSSSQTTYKGPERRSQPNVCIECGV